MIDLAVVEQCLARWLEPSKAAAIFQAARARWYRRDIDAAVQYVGRLVGRTDTDWWIYGAGSHTRSLWNHPRFPRGRFRGLIDLRATVLSEKGGWDLPVLGLEALGGSERLPVLLSHGEFEHNMRRLLLREGVEPERIFSIYDQDEYGRLADMPRATLPQWSGRGLNIAVVSVLPTTIVAAGYWGGCRDRHAVVHFDCTRDGCRLHPALFRVDCRQSLQHLLQGLEDYRPQVIYVYDQFNTGNFVALLLKAVFPQVRVIGECYDVLRLFFGDPAIMTRQWYWDDTDLEVALTAEKEGFELLDGVVFKEDPKAMAGVLPKRARALHAWPYVMRDELAFAPCVTPAEPARLVWAGSIIPSSLSPQLFRDGQILPVLEALAQQGLHLTLIPGCADESRFEALYPDYVRFLKAQQRVSFYPGFPRPELIRFLAGHFDFGLLLNWIPDPGAARKGLQSTLASKLLTYIAAGLPVIVSQEFGYMARIVAEYGVGIRIPAADVGNVAMRIRDCDYATLKARVRAMQSMIVTEKHDGRLWRFLTGDARRHDEPGSRSWIVV